jgi:hypothetical protein
MHVPYRHSSSDRQGPEGCVIVHQYKTLVILLLLKKPARRRKVRGELPSLTEAEMQQYRSALYGVAAAVGHAPRLSLAG